MILIVRYLSRITFEMCFTKHITIHSFFYLHLVQIKVWYHITNAQQLKLWHDSKTQIVTKLKNSNYDKTKKNSKLWLNSKIQIVTNLKNSNCDKTIKKKLWQNSKTQIGTGVTEATVVTEVTTKFNRVFFFILFCPYNSITQIVTKLKNTNCDKIQKLRLRQNSKTQIVASLKNLNDEQTKKIVQKLKTKIVTKLKNLNCWQNSTNPIVTILKNSNCDNSYINSSDSSSSDN